MATVNGKSGFRQHNVMECTWTLIPSGSVGTPEQLSRWPDHSIFVTGTFGGATVTVEGSDDGVTYFTLTAENPAGGADTLVSTTSAQRYDAKAVPLHIRPKTTGGDGTTAITVIITSKGYGH